MADKARILIPALASKKADLKRSQELSFELEAAGYDSGLMLVMQDGLAGLSMESREAQYQNLREIVPDNRRDDPMVVMLSNLPIWEMDWLNQPKTALDHVMQGISFAAGLPHRGRCIVTFHLNSLVTDKDFREKDAARWHRDFLINVAARLERLAHYAADKGVDLKVETVPVPEFGDSDPGNAQRGYRNVPLHELRNPWYLWHGWGFKELRDCGLGICLDLCHSHQLYRQAWEPRKHGLFPEDVARIKSTSRSLMDDVLALEPTDIVHLNDGRGVYTTSARFDEGVALGKGEIHELPEIMDLLEERGNLCVLEVDEGGDFVKRPGTTQSIDWLKARAAAEAA